MCSQRLKGLARVRKRPATGKTIYYCYAWRGGPLLRNDSGPIQPDDPALPAAHQEAHERRRNPNSTTMGGLITAYRASADFKLKAALTRREYDRYLDDLRSEFGNLSIGDLEAKETRVRFKAWRDAMSDRPRTADYAWSTLSRVLSFGKDRGILSVNIAERGGRLYRGNRRDKIWNSADINAFLAVAPRSLQLAMQLAIWTGQRKADLLKLKWSQCTIDVIRLRQGKTGARVAIPIAKQLRAELDLEPHVAETVLTTTRFKRPWTSDGFDTAWKLACKNAGIEDLTFHDLRGTAVTRLALAGCTAAEIGALTGHAMRDVDLILDAHYLGGRPELARRAIEKLEAV
ncbi:integrase [Neorhizobium sp. P12A]|nr:integrase [Neorhizobium sp. P12A]